MNPIKKVLEVWKNSDGIATAKDKYIDYKEAHTLQYSFMKGFTTIRWSSYREQVRSRQQVFKVWEANEGQYWDYALTGGYILNKVLIIMLMKYGLF